MITLLLSAAFAAPLVPQFALAPSGSTQEGPEDVRWLMGSATFFWVPSPQEDTGLALSYLGPAWKFWDSYTLAPQVGLIANWYGQGDLGGIVSIWNTLDISQRLHLFVEVEAYVFVDGRPLVYYGLYKGWYQSKVGSLGVHCEMVDDLVFIGWHYRLPIGSRYAWTLGTYTNVATDETAIRQTFELNL